MVLFWEEIITGLYLDDFEFRNERKNPIGSLKGVFFGVTFVLSSDSITIVSLSQCNSSKKKNRKEY